MTLKTMKCIRRNANICHNRDLYYDMEAIAFRESMNIADTVRDQYETCLNKARLSGMDLYYCTDELANMIEDMSNTIAVEALLGLCVDYDIHGGECGMVKDELIRLITWETSDELKDIYKL